jgi:hypothetical protein
MRGDPLCEIVFKRVYLKEGRISEIGLNAPFDVVAANTQGSGTVQSGCRARIRTWAKGSKVPCATTTQLGNLNSAEGRARTDMGVAPQQFLRLSRLPIPPLRLIIQMERKTRFELATSSLARRRSTAELLPPSTHENQKFSWGSIPWCRGGDLNSYELSLTTPSRWRVYRFHHLGLLYCFSSFSPGKYHLRHPHHRLENLPKRKVSPRIIRMMGQV